MRTVLANELIWEGAFEDVLKHGLFLDLFQMLVDLVGHWDKEIERVLLLTNIHFLAPHAERLPERLGQIVFQLALFQMCFQNILVLRFLLI